MALLIAGSAYGADLTIEVGSPVAASGSGPGVVSKVKGAVFSVRTKGCATNTKFSGRAVAEGWTSELVFTEGSPGAFSVSPKDWRNAAWVAVITAECSGAKAGALVPVGANNAYDRAASKFLTHAPTDKEIADALKGAKP
jgi:hypothetical protein